nr:hypothetical protein [Tanacetum cinerariifolium]
MPKSSSPDITPKEETVTLDRPKSPNPFLPVIQETKSSSAMDTSPRHPSPPTPVVGEMHKEAQKAAGSPTSSGGTSEDGAHPQLRSVSNPSVLIDKTKSAIDGLKTAHTTSIVNEESRADDISQKVKPNNLVDILKDTRSAFFTPDSSTDELIIVSDVSKEEENAKNDKDAEDSLVYPPSPKSVYFKTSHDFASCLPTELKELPSKIIGLSGEIKELKQHIKDMEIELPRDLKEIPSKLETFTSTISNISSQVAELKNIQWEFPAEFLDLPHLASSVQEKLKTLDSFLGLFKTVTNTLNRFASLVENASGATITGVPSADKATTSPDEGEKDADTNLKNELVDLLGIDIVIQYYNKKLFYERYREKMNKKRQSSMIINCDVLTKRVVVQACPDRKEKGWKIIYELIKTRMKYLEQTEKELHIDFNKYLQEQDPLDELNDLANKKRKRTVIQQTIPGYNGEIRAKGTLKKSCLPPRWSPRHPSPPTPVVGEMHKEAQKAAGSPTSLGGTSEDGAHPQLRSVSNPSVLIDKTKSARDGLKTAHTTSIVNEESRADDISQKVKPNNLVDILKDTRSAFFTPDSSTYELIIVSDVSEEEENAKNDKDAEDTSHDFASCLPTELKELPSKIIGLSGEIKELKQHIKDMEIELPGDLKEIPSKLETFTSTISNISSQVAELKNIQWEFPAEFLDLPHLASLVQEKLKTLDSFPGLFKTVTNTLNRFASLVENASGATITGVPSADKATTSPD